MFNLIPGPGIRVVYNLVHLINGITVFQLPELLEKLCNLLLAIFFAHCRGFIGVVALLPTVAALLYLATKAIFLVPVSVSF